MAHNAAFAFATRDRFGRRTDECRIVDRLFTVSPEIFHRVPQRSEELFNSLFVPETGVIRPDGNSHGPIMPRGGLCAMPYHSPFAIASRTVTPGAPLV